MARAEDFAGQHLFGQVRRFSGGWGFLVSDSYEGDCFVGVRSNSHLPEGSLREGVQVEFDVKLNGAKAEATNVSIVGGSGAPQTSQPTNGFHTPIVPGSLSDGTTADQYAGEQLTGEVRKFQAGWGFIVSESFEGDIFVGQRANRHLPDGLLKEGSSVQFTVKVNGTKAEAVDVQVLGGYGVPLPASTAATSIVQGVAPPSQLIGQRITGVVKSFRDGWGFINSEQFEGDLFLHKGSNPSISHADPGDLVEFTIAKDERAKGGVQASETTFKVFEQSALVGKRCAGTVKSFRGDWGFLQSDRFPGDLFVGTKSGQNSEVGATLTAGEQVTFEIALDGSKCCAVNTRRVSLGTAPAIVPAAAGQPDLGQLFQKMGQMGLPTHVVNTVMTAVASSNRGGHVVGLRPPKGGVSSAEGMVGKTCSGWVKSFKDDWGFINSHFFQGDLFVGLRENPNAQGLEANQAVEFEVTKRGNRIEATNVRKGGPGKTPIGLNGADRARSRTPPPAQVGGGDSHRLAQLQLIGKSVYGTVKSFRDTWGFVNSAAFRGDLFFGLKNNPGLDAERMQPAQQVSFDITQGSTGKPEAINVVPV
mmetsp:Transcript_115784/g.327491  ORF Transcript_115784/g.327491 Transcript_115784/m.327491 type:complete len:588 (+) Transcript_115784:58-1821(+)|eukprot:CAMPEP_0117504046 /NCGR_PEP_ID=MMETSP0784-20121206/24646_1 /TAXON_ID=39447 /ORGANISM="" /LENGTH=587 /DNA_ID=CAMNT_0005299387 /DNA_START=107 /DNA_END=1870 /DNA_ORIENTATION=-